MKTFFQLAVTTVVSVLALTGPVHSANAGGDWGIPRDGIVLRLNKQLGLVGGTDRGPSVTVWASGRVDVHYPVFMKRAGDYRVQLDGEELNGLIQEITERSIHDFDAAAVRQKMAVPDKSGDVITVNHVSDPGRSTFEIRLLNGVAKTPHRYVIEWPGLQRSARAHPGITELSDLVWLEHRLLDYGDDPRAINRSTP